MPQKRLKLKEKFLLGLLGVVLTSLLISITFSYIIFLFNINKTLDPELKIASDVISSRLNEQKDKQLILNEFLVKEDSLKRYLKNEASENEITDQVLITGEKTGFDIIQIFDVSGNYKVGIEHKTIKNNTLNTAFVSKASKGIKISTFEALGDKLYITSYFPVEDANGVSGILATAMEVNNTALDKAIGSLSNEVSVYTINGFPIASTLTGKDGQKLTRELSKDEIKEITEGNKEYIKQERVGDEGYKSIYTPVRDYDGKTIAILSTALPLAPIVSNNTTTIIILLFSNLLTILLTYIVAAAASKKLIDPILTIKKGTELIGRGNLDYRIKLNTNDETEDLAVSFNEMAQRLRDGLNEVSNEKNKIAAERNKFSSVLEGVQDAIITLDLERKISFFNKSAENITGLKKEDVIGKPCDEVLIVFRSKVRISASDFCPLTSVQKDQVIFSDRNLKLVTSKRELFISMTSSVITDFRLANLGAILTIIDSSKERELEEMKLDFVSMAAHELRTPLTSIRGYLALVKDSMKDRIKDDEIMYMERVDISSNQLAALVENLLDVSKIEHNTLVIEVKKEDWTAVVKAVVREFDQIAMQKKITLKFEDPSYSLSPAAVDKFRISEVISNLVANAINYTESGGSVTVSTNEKEGRIETSIKDTGVGIPERSITHLFTKFYRVSGSLEQGSKGTGLGLYISKSIVNKHKGEIWVESKEGVGSTFTFTVPVYKDEDFVTNKF